MDLQDSHSTSSLLKGDHKGCFSFLSLIKKVFPQRKVIPILTDGLTDADSRATQVEQMLSLQLELELKALVGVLSSLLISNM